MDNTFALYIQSIKSHKQLSEQECVEIFKDIETHKHKLIVHNLRLVVSIAKELNVAWSNIDIMDMIQEGNIGLIKAVQTFDISRGIQFSTYATYIIKNDILRFIKTTCTPVNIYTTKEQRVIINNFTEIKNQLENHGVTIDSLAERYGVHPCGIINTLNLEAVDIGSLNDNELIRDLIDSGPEKLYIKNEESEVLSRKIKNFKDSLDKIDKAIFYENLYLGAKTLAEIGRDFNITRSAVKARRDKVLIEARTFFTKADLISLIGDI